MIILDARFERSEARHPLFPYPVWEFKEADANSNFFCQDKQAPTLRSVKRQIGQLKTTLANKKENDDTTWPEDYTLKRFTIIEGLMTFINASTANKNPAKRLKEIDALFQTIYAPPLLDDFVEPQCFQDFRWNLCVEYQFGHDVATTSKIASRVAELDSSAAIELLSLGITSVLQSKASSSEVMKKLVAGLSDCDRCKRSSWSAM
jgi:hypothetical protein